MLSPSTKPLARSASWAARSPEPEIMMPWELRYQRNILNLPQIKAEGPNYVRDSLIVYRSAAYSRSPISTATVMAFFADSVCAVSGGRAAEEEGGGAHCVPARDRRHQQPHAGLPCPFLRRYWRNQVGSPRADQC